MDEISQEPKREFRLPPGLRRWLTVVGAAGLVAVIAVVTVVGVNWLIARHAGGATSGPTATASPDSEPGIAVSAEPTRLREISSPVPVRSIVASTVPPPPIPAAPRAAPGTGLLTCDSVVWGQPRPGWQTGSLRVGSLWLLDGRHLGYARLGRTQQASGGPADHGGVSRSVTMLVHVGTGSTVVMRAAAGASRYFQFQGPDGGRGFTFAPCAAPDLGYGGLIAYYDVGFSIVPGHTASVEVWTSPSARPVWLTFTAPAGQA